MRTINKDVRDEFNRRCSNVLFRTWYWTFLFLSLLIPAEFCLHASRLVEPESESILQNIESLLWGIGMFVWLMLSRWTDMGHKQSAASLGVLLLTTIFAQMAAYDAIQEASLGLYAISGAAVFSGFFQQNQRVEARKPRVD